MKNLDIRMSDVELMCKDILNPKKGLPPELFKIWAERYKAEEKIRFAYNTPYEHATAAEQRKLESELRQECWNTLVKTDKDFKQACIAEGLLKDEYGAF